jgi:hypothetical protein
VQYSWIKNEEFAGEFYAYDNGYYDQAGFSKVTGVAGPDTGSPSSVRLGAGRADRCRIRRRRRVGAERPAEDHRDDLPEEPFTILSLKDKGNIATPKDLIGKKIGVQDSNASVFKALLAANGISGEQLTIVPVDFDPTPLMQRRRRRLHGLPHQRGHHGRDGGIPDHQPRLRRERSALRRRVVRRHRPVPRRAQGPAEGVPHRGDQGLDRHVHQARRRHRDGRHEALQRLGRGGDLTFGELNPAKVKAGIEAQAKLISTDETQANGLFTISDDLKSQTLASLKASGWELTADQLFDTSIIDEIYAEHPELKKYLP